MLNPIILTSSSCCCCAVFFWCVLQYLVFEYIEHTLLQVLEASSGGLHPDLVRAGRQQRGEQQGKQGRDDAPRSSNMQCNLGTAQEKELGALGGKCGGSNMWQLDLC
jgi:hypothetical protein